MPKRAHKSERLGRPVFSPSRDARAQLLTAATELIAGHGVAATSFTTIAKRAGLTPAMVHYYFKSRDQLLDAVVEERLVPFITYVWDPVQTGADAAELLRGVVERLLAGIERAPWVPSTWVREILNQGGLLRDKVLPRIPFDKVRILAASIHRGQTQHTLNPDLDPLLVVFSTLGLVMLHMATVSFWAETFHRPAPGRTTMRRHITGLLLNGLRYSPPAPRKKTSNKSHLRSQP
jgi:TetR/AcrR family transcriptional regulator